MYTIAAVETTGKTFNGHAETDYLIENAAGEQRWLRGCILLDIEEFTDEDWNLLEESVDMAKWLGVE